VKVGGARSSAAAISKKRHAMALFYFLLWH
jgi:hypothetical protein